MLCPQCQHINRDVARFCAACAHSLGAACVACGTPNPAGAAFCDHCATPLLTDTTLPTRRGGWAEWRLHALLPEVIRLLQCERRVTYRRLQYLFRLNDVLLEEICEELTLRRLAFGEEGKVLVWTGEAQPAVQPAVAIPSPPAITDSPAVASITEPRTLINGSAVRPEAASVEASYNELTVIPESAYPAADAERRQLTVMFCDLADSTRLSQQLDPEDLREVIIAYQATAAAVVQQFEGHIAQYLGDGVLIYFGWPQAHENDAHRALHAGLGIVEAVNMTLNPHLEREKGVQLTVRLGIHTGPVVVGEMGGGERHEHLATGETVHLAARLEGLAAPNTVVISQVTARLVQGAFTLEDRGPQVLKGVAEPVSVFRVMDSLERYTDETTASGVSFLVGRDEEVGLLLRRWEQSKTGLGQVVLLRGEAGIGKSSLVTTLRQRVMQESYPCITFRCSPYHTNSALYPMIARLQSVLQWQAGETPETRLAKLEGVLKGYRHPLEEIVPLYAALLSVPVPNGRYPELPMTPQQQRQQTQEALVGWLLEEAERHPTLLIWEDLHWADPSTLDLLGLLVEQTPTVPMLHVLTFRPGFEPPWRHRAYMTPLTLNRLEHPQVEALLTYLTRGKALPGQVVQHIVTKTDGVPLYVTELTKMLLDSTLMRQEADRYELTGPLTTVSIPETLQDSLMARLDQLKQAKEVAQLGAVLGREFSYEMLQALAVQDDKTVQAGLAQLVEAELLYQRGRPPRARYIFKHALIQDAAYASLLKSIRQKLHQRIAQLLEVQFPETVATQPELLAHHYTQAGCYLQGVAYWQQAGQRANARSAYMEAVRHLTMGLEVLEHLPDTTERAHQELTLRLALGPALIATRGQASPEVAQVYTRAWALGQHLGEPPQAFPALWGLWRLRLVRGEIGAARALAEQMLRLGEHTHDLEQRLWGHSALGTSLFFQGTLLAAQEHLQRGLALDDAIPHYELALRYGTHPDVFCQGYVADGLWYLGYPDQASVLIQETVALARSLGHPLSLGLALSIAALTHLNRCEPEIAQAYIADMLGLATQHTFPLWSAMAMLWRGWALAQQGQWHESLVQLRQGWEAIQGTGAALNQPLYFVLFAESYAQVDQLETGLAMLDEALEVIETTQQRYWEAKAHQCKGELLLRLAVPEAVQAEACFQRALDVARAQQAKSWELQAATSLARLWHSQGKRQEAYDLLAPVYHWFTEGFGTADLKEAQGVLETLEHRKP